MQSLMSFLGKIYFSQTDLKDFWHMASMILAWKDTYVVPQGWPDKASKLLAWLGWKETPKLPRNWSHKICVQ